MLAARSAYSQCKSFGRAMQTAPLLTPRRLVFFIAVPVVDAVPSPQLAQVDRITQNERSELRVPACVRESGQDRPPSRCSPILLPRSGPGLSRLVAWCADALSGSASCRPSLISGTTRKALSRIFPGPSRLVSLFALRSWLDEDLQACAQERVRSALIGEQSATRFEIPDD